MLGCWGSLPWPLPLSTFVFSMPSFLLFPSFCSLPPGAQTAVPFSLLLFPTALSLSFLPSLPLSLPTFFPSPAPSPLPLYKCPFLCSFSCLRSLTSSLSVEWMVVVRFGAASWCFPILFVWNIDKPRPSFTFFFSVSFRVLRNSMVGHVAVVKSFFDLTEKF